MRLFRIWRARTAKASAPRRAGAGTLTPSFEGTNQNLWRRTQMTHIWQRHRQTTKTSPQMRLSLPRECQSTHLINLISSSSHLIVFRFSLPYSRLVRLRLIWRPALRAACTPFPEMHPTETTAASHMRVRPSLSQPYIGCPLRPSSRTAPVVCSKRRQDVSRGNMFRTLVVQKKRGPGRRQALAQAMVPAIHPRGLPGQER